MSLWLGFLITLVTVPVAEFFVYLIHKYIMHGRFGWGWHESHHRPHDHALERNDLYAIVFALMTIGLFWIGNAYWEPLWWIALGITVYGLLYAFVHDALVHKRWPFKTRAPRNAYLKRLYQAHLLHHATEGREGGVSFGFLYAPPVPVLKQRLAEQAAHDGVELRKGAAERV